MPSPKPRIVFSKVIPALQADRHGVMSIQYGLNNSAARRLNIVSFGKPGGAICGLMSLGPLAFFSPPSANSSTNI